MPLSVLQKRWLKALCNDKRIRLFVSDEVLERLKNQLQDVEALFNENDYYLYDKYSDGDPYDDFEYIRDSLLALLDRPDRPTCILLPDDASYFGTLDTIRERGLRVPEDISIAGYDGIRSVLAVRPRLTTIRQNSDAMGRQAALKLIDRIDHPTTAISDSTLIPVTLIEGESLGQAPTR